MMNRDSFTNSLLSTISASRKISRYTYQPLQAEVSRIGALSAVKNMLRRSRKHPSVELKEDAAKAEGVSDVALSLSSLPPKYRMPVHLYYYEGYSISEIARLLRRPAATVGTQLARGRELLRGILGGEYDEK